MATFVKSDAFVSGNKKVRTGKLTLGTYATGGEAIAPSVFGLRGVTSLKFCGAIHKSDFTDAIVPSLIPASTPTGSLKIAAYRQKDPADTGGADIAIPEVANATSLTGYSAIVEVTGY